MDANIYADYLALQPLILESGTSKKESMSWNKWHTVETVTVRISPKSIRLYRDGITE